MNNYTPEELEVIAELERNPWTSCFCGVVILGRASDMPKVQVLDDASVHELERCDETTYVRDGVAAP